MQMTEACLLVWSSVYLKIIKNVASILLLVLIFCSNINYAKVLGVRNI